MQWLPPFDDNSASVVYEAGSSISTHRFSPDMNVLFISERPGGAGGGFARGGRGAGGGTAREYAVFLDDSETTHTLVEYDSGDFYANPGSLVMTGGAVAGGGRRRRGGGGGGSEATVQISSDGDHVFFAGTQYDENPLDEAPKSFLDRIEIRTGEKERVYESDNDGSWERISSILDIDAGRFVVSHETPTEIAQSFLMDDGRRTQLTENVDYTPDITAAPR